MRVPLFANYVTWPKPQNNISKHLNQNDNENKMYSAIDVPFHRIGDGQLRITGFANATPFAAIICAPYA